LIVPDGFIQLSRSLQSAAGSPQRGGSPPRAPVPTADWTPADLARAAALLHASYPHDIGRHFAPHGTALEWLRYITALVLDSPCGAFSPELTRVVRDGETLRALALVTRVSPGTAHLAQLAVRADARRQGVARMLVNDISEAAAAAGCAELTLLVAAENAAARKLYDALGFTKVSR
jgi:ribosomal protein S18 acetylase RimI-like enzyme